MKKILCILTILCCLAGSGAYADRHVEVQCTFEGALAGEALSFDIYEQEGRQIAVTSLMKDEAVILGEAGEGRSVTDLFCLLRNDILSALERKVKAIEKEWTGLQTVETIPGTFSGELFDNAGTLSAYEFRLADFTAFLKEKTVPEDNAGGTQQTVNRIIAAAADGLQEIVRECDPVLSVREYDEGKYVTMLVKTAGEIIATVSLDCSSGADRHALISYRTEGRYCYHDIEYRISMTETTAAVSFYTGEASSFSAVQQGYPLFTRRLSLTSEEDGTAVFRILYETPKLTDPLCIQGTGSLQNDGTGWIRASASIQGNEQDAMNAEIFLEDLYSAVSFTDKQIRDLNNPEERDGIELSFLSGLTLAAAEIIPTLPVDYQTVLLTYFYQ